MVRFRRSSHISTASAVDKTVLFLLRSRRLPRSMINNTTRRILWAATLRSFHGDDLGVSMDETRKTERAAKSMTGVAMDAAFRIRNEAPPRITGSGKVSKTN